MDDLQAAQDKLMERRKLLGLEPTTKTTPTISTEIDKVVDDLNKCWQHKDQEKPCPICEAEKQKFIDRCRAKNEQDRIEAEARKEAAKKRLYDQPEEAMFKAGAPRRYLHCSLDNYQGGDKYKAICRKCAENPFDLVLWGIPGTGKTHLAISILREIIRTGRRAVFATVPDLLMEIRSTYRPDGGDEGAVVDKYESYPVLILDDMGAEYTTPWSITALHLIIDRRYREMKPTIITTNLSPKEVEQHISPRIASRMADMTIGEIKMPDYRRRRTA